MGTGVTPAIWPPGKSKRVESRELRVLSKELTTPELSNFATE
jgi:hypothetical protein